jgi:hypothetical protein
MGTARLVAGQGRASSSAGSERPECVMSIVSRHINQRVTNRLLQPTRYVTKLDVDQVLSIVREVVGPAEGLGPAEEPGPAGLRPAGPQRLPAGPESAGTVAAGPVPADEKLWFAGSAPGPWEIHLGPASAKDASRVGVPTWTTQLALKASSSGAATLVTVSLAKWKTREGMLVGKREFEQFLADLTDRISARDPAYSVLDGSFFRH